MTRAILLALLLLPLGCAFETTEIGVPLPASDGLSVGHTTRAEALALLGPPRLVRRQFDGELYTWRRSRSTSRSITILPAYVKAFHYAVGESRRDDLTLLFDRKGILRGVGLRRETEEE